MKKYQKAKIVAKNLPTGSYAAGCPANLSSDEGGNCIISFSSAMKANCKKCERSK